MAKKVEMVKKIVYVTTRLVIEAKEDFDVDEVVNEMDYNFTSQTDEVTITDTEIMESEEKIGPWHP